MQKDHAHSFAQRKDAHLFMVLNAKPDSHLGADDFNLLADRLCANFCAQRGSPADNAMRSVLMRDWEEVVKADANGDGEVTIDEWHAFKSIKRQGKTPRSFFTDYAKALFGLASVMQGGVFNEAAMRALVMSYNGVDVDVELLFRLLSKDTGEVSQDDLEKILVRYVESHDPSDPANYVFGNF